MKILIVEDDLVSRRLLRKMLEQWGYEVTSAKNGQDAWEIYQSNEFKFVVADWMMPVMDGLKLCRKIRAINNKGYVYFILLTSKDKKRISLRALKQVPTTM